MAVEYAKVLHALNVGFEVVGRGTASASRFFETTGISAHIGGIEAYLDTIDYKPEQAIVCVTENMLGEATRTLLRKGVKSILVEKPGGLTPEDVMQTEAISRQVNAEVFVGYNRRFYASVIKAQEIIKADGGVSSLYFEFTEWSHVIEELQKAPGVKENWFLANSSHVVDLAFYLGGNPLDICCFTAGGVNWHPSAAVFAGAGKTETGALFSYHANWGAPGRWSLEVMTRAHRLVFKPIEKLHIQKIGSILVEECPIDDELDKNYKPGLYRQTELFLRNNKKLLTLSEQANLMEWYLKINNKHN